VSSPLRTTSGLQATYTVLAPFYDALVPWVSSEARAIGHSWVQVEDGEWVLDVGTGTGLALQRLVAANPSGWTEGVDLTPAMLRRARRRLDDTPHTRYGLRQADATALPYPHEAFDAVFASYLVDVLPRSQRRRALQELHRVLRPAGRLVLVYLTGPRRRREWVLSRLAHSAPLLFGGARPIAPLPLLRRCGFKIEAHAPRSQAGLRTGVTRATPS
jgi:demethylmenaquinone methyltransferase/2-methoxy-6-polyprenyl-1,4-benzoquinol methylase